MCTKYAPGLSWRTASMVVPAALALVSGVSAPAGAGPAQQMPVKTGRVTYQMSGPIRGSMVLAWTDHGKKFRQETKMTADAVPAPGGQKSGPVTMNTWVLSDGKAMYALMPMGGNQVMRLKGKALGPTGAPMGLGQILGQMGGVSGGEPAGTATVLGQPCEIRATEKGKGLPLRAEMQMNPEKPKLVVVATKLETSPKLPATLFKLPPGAQVIEMPEGGPAMPPGIPRR